MKAILKQVGVLAIMMCLCISGVVFGAEKQEPWDTVFSKGLLAAARDGKWGYVDIKGTFKIQPTYDQVRPFTDSGLAVVKIAGKYGAIDQNGRWAVKPIYDWMDESWGFRNGFCAVGVGKLKGFVDAGGKMAVEPKYDWVNPFTKDGYALVSKDEKWGYISRQGTEVVAPRFLDHGVPEYVFPHGFTEGFVAVDVDGKFGYLRADGTLPILPVFDFAKDFKHGIAEVEMNGKKAVIDETGKILVQQTEDLVTGEGLIGFRKGSLWGYMNAKGKVVIAPQFKEIKAFSDGLAPVKWNKAWGYIDRSGKTVVKPAYSEAGSYAGGLAYVKSDQFRGYLSKNGHVAVRLPKTRCGDYANGRVWFEKNKKYGYLNEEGRIVISPKFDSLFKEDVTGMAADFKNDGYTVVRVGKYYGVIDRLGKYVIQPKLQGVLVTYSMEESFYLGQ